MAIWGIECGLTVTHGNKITKRDINKYWGINSYREFRYIKKENNKYFYNKISGIYKITNILNNDYYIGSSNNIKVRWTDHSSLLKNNKHSNIFFQRAYNKYGKHNFKFEIIATCPNEYLIRLEQWFIDNLNPKYNLAKICKAPMQGKTHSEKSKQKMKDNNTSKIKQNVVDDIIKYSQLGESRANISRLLNINKTFIGKVLNKQGRFGNNTDYLKIENRYGKLAGKWDEVYKMYIKGNSSYKLANLYGVSRTYINKIVTKIKNNL